MVITQADKHISNYYEVILNKLAETKRKKKLHYLLKKWKKYIDSRSDGSKCNKQIKEERLDWREEDLIDLFGKKTIH